jgi:hypothetical protein
MYTSNLYLVTGYHANAVSVPHQQYILTNETERIRRYRGPRVKHVV